ncbi:MAG: peptidoglycan DD-metalloendopeptidase family protein [Oscillospiraceae bacterium]
MNPIILLIFAAVEVYITSGYGYRTIFGKRSMHSGVDYGTNNKKLAQYAIEDGYVFAAAKSNSDGALYVWVIYPRIKKAFLHYHLDSYCVKSGQAVKKGTLLGYTGKTGKATGIHLHLGVRDLVNLTANQIKSMNWALLRKCNYIDAEKLTYIPPTQNPYPVPKRAVTKGDVGDDVKWVQWELVRLGYNIGTAINGTLNGIDGHCGPATTRAIKDFQSTHKDQNGRRLKPDGQAGPLTRWAMSNY